MTAEALELAEMSMGETIEAVLREFGTVRTGRATPALLDQLRVDAYGAQTPLRQVANVTAPSPTLLVVQPYDPNIVSGIGTAIRNSDLGLNPSIDGALVRVPVPPPTEETRKELVKLLHRMAEEGRVSVRRARQEAREEILRIQKDGEASEDECRRAMAELQKLTDDNVARIQTLLEKREAEVMTV
ncbi:MAG: ribosome recycling factor [Gemmatimonadetes bacterium]|nr:ribosome recycling factor [Gemmatimonadota bacterium]